MDLRIPKLDGVEAIRVVAAGESLLAPRVTRGIIARFVAQHPTDVALQKRAELLSERELEVLRSIGQGLTNAEIGWRPYSREVFSRSPTPVRAAALVNPRMPPLCGFP